MTGTGHPRRWWALGALALALLAFGLDVTILNVALPTLATDLQASTSQLQWFANAYTLVLAAGLLPAGTLGDRFGQKPLLLGALTTFGLASLACAYAADAGQLIAARALLGVGAAVLVPLSMSMLTVLFPAEERGRAIAVWTTAMAIGIPLGPVLGGWLLDHFWWGSVFLINVPLVVLGIAALAWLLPRTRGSGGVRFDGPGIALSSAGLLALTYGLVTAGEDGWLAPAALVPMLAGGLLLAGFGLRLRRAAHPLVDLALFRAPGFTWGAVLATVASFALMGAMFVLPQYFQAVLGADALGTGLRLLPIVGGLLVGVRVAERVRPRLGAKVVVATGFGLITAGLVAGATTSVSDGYGFVAAWVSLVGLGLGFALPPAMDLAMGAIGPARSGVGSGLLQAMRQVGGTFGVAVLGTVLNAGYRAGVDVTGLPPAAAAAARDSAAAGVKVARATGAPGLLDSVRTAFVAGSGTALLVCAALTTLGLALAVAYLPRQAADRAQSEHGVLTG
ncbi:drug resistance transporter, EmrB/QacA subfamily [Amycolatopsis arida]|uniref:Drug resistance transporter, EmrB/QacA subfamily n=1 Tax=Amycolatopsis arida TaxID=587909 RepID=A0A1I5S7A4_9PSEU|nr:DHA2 family efflux MFS transporter permease subunit [Amycolatopsis arida]TDX85307.1 EmrB/QacA subfamily drug resistance transporter [Amycolatopsis arida]SFP66561.1 drug resistance transporter, EmrB/QacA subfamily [Amycolatopsis arida]